MKGRVVDRAAKRTIYFYETHIFEKREREREKKEASAPSSYE